MDILPGLLYVSMTTAVVAVSYGLSVQAGFEPARVRWLATAVFSLSVIVASGLLLGILGFLRPLGFVVLVGALVAVTTAIVRRDGSVAQVAQRAREDLAGARAVATQSPLTIALTIVVGCGLGWTVLVGYLLPPVGWDSLGYHVPPMIDYIQTERITTVGYSVFANAYPKDLELFFLWNVVFLGEDTIVNTSQIWFAPIGALATYTLASDLGVDSEDAYVAAAIFLCSPIVLLQAVTTYVDLGYGALIVVSFAVLLRYWRRPATRYAVVLGLAAGLIVGIKYTGGLFFLTIGAGLLAVYLTRRRRDLPLDSFGPHLAVFLVLAGCLGGFWYLRNVLLYGNPVYPFAIDAFGVHLFGGTHTVQDILLNGWGKVSKYHGPFDATSVVEKLYLSHFEKTPFYTKARAVGGYGPQWAILALPALVLFVAHAIRDRDRDTLFVLALFLVPLALTVGPWRPRYNLYLLALGAVAVGFVRHTVLTDSRQVVSVLVVVLLAFSLVMATPFNPLRYDSYVERSLTTDGDRTSMEIRPGAAPVSADTYDALFPPGSKLGFALGGNDLPYTLYDSGLRNEITSVSDYDDASAFEAGVRSAGIDYLVLAKTGPHVEWARQLGYETRHENDEYVVFEVGA